MSWRKKWENQEITREVLFGSRGIGQNKCKRWKIEGASIKVKTHSFNICLFAHSFNEYIETILYFDLS